MYISYADMPACISRLEKSEGPSTKRQLQQVRKTWQLEKGFYTRPLMVICQLEWTVQREYWNMVVLWASIIHVPVYHIAEECVPFTEFALNMSKKSRNCIFIDQVGYMSSTSRYW